MARRIKLGRPPTVDAGRVISLRKQARELRLFLKGIGLARVRFHDLRASWATVLLTKGVEPITVMKMGGWKDMKTMMYYVRMAGVDVEGATDILMFDKPRNRMTRVVL